MDDSEPCWWLSFADPDKPRGRQFLGVVITGPAPDVVTARMRMAIEGVPHLGGEVLGAPLPKSVSDRLLPSDFYRVMSRSDAEALDARLGGDGLRNGLDVN